MKTFVIKRFVPIVLILFIVSGCAIFKGDKKPVELRFSYNNAAYINYGYSFELRSTLIYNSGKEKDVTNKDELSVNVAGASYYNGKVYIEQYPKKLSSNIIKASASYSKDEVSLSTSIAIPFNYLGAVQLDFSGDQGSSGSKGEKGSTPLLFRDGTSGGTGGQGGDGSPGDNLTVYVWKDSIDFYFIKVTNLTSGENYIYKIKNNGFGFLFNVNGGQGGTGGEGGDGGNGKDGSSNNNKVKVPGNGGSGGMGGVGGTGGKGGSVYIFIHPNAAEIQSLFVVYNYGGPYGIGGKGGDGGNGGRPLEGQTAGTNGSKGAGGLNGYSGTNGDVVQVIVEEFDIEY